MPTESKRFYAGAFFLDRRGQQVLLMHRDEDAPVNPGKWAFFGGGSEEGETPVATCLREVEEETGIALQPDDLTPVRSYFNDSTGYDRHVFCVEQYIEPVRIRLGEGQGFSWFPLAKLARVDLISRGRADLEFYLNQPPRPDTQTLEEGTELLLDFDKLSLTAGVIPVAVQHADTDEVILVAYTNQQALDHSLKTRIATFWSTSRNKLWIKGAESGNTYELVEARVNCEQNSLLYQVRPRAGGICHTSNGDGQARDCYYRRLNLDSGQLEHLDP